MQSGGVPRPKLSLVNPNFGQKTEHVKVKHVRIDRAHFRVHFRRLQHRTSNEASCKAPEAPALACYSNPPFMKMSPLGRTSAQRGAWPCWAWPKRSPLRSPAWPVVNCWAAGPLKGWVGIQLWIARLLGAGCTGCTTMVPTALSWPGVSLKSRLPNLVRQGIGCGGEAVAERAPGPLGPCGHVVPIPLGSCLGPLRS